MTLDRKPTAKPRGLALAIAAAATLATGLFMTNGAGAASSGGIGDFAAAQTAEEKDRTFQKRVDRKYKQIWRYRISRRDRRWANRTAECESGRDPDAIGGGGRYRGAFQFRRKTWKTSPGSPGGDPIDYSYATQAVVAVKLKKRDGRGHWPNCG